MADGTGVGAGRLIGFQTFFPLTKVQIKEPLFCPALVQLWPDLAANAAVSKIELTGMAITATKRNTTENRRLAIRAGGGQILARFTMSRD